MNRPYRKFLAGNVQVALWQNEGKSTFYTVTITRRFKDKEDNWKSSGSLRISDIPKAIVALEEAYRFVMLKEQAREPEEIEELQ